MYFYLYRNPNEEEEKLLHVVSGITQNLALHPANRTRLYKAELHGSLALDHLIEHVRTALGIAWGRGGNRPHHVN